MSVNCTNSFFSWQTLKFLTDVQLGSSRLRFNDVYTDDEDEEDTNKTHFKMEINYYIVTKFIGKKSVHHYNGLVTDKDGEELFV